MFVPYGHPPPYPPPHIHHHCHPCEPCPGGRVEIIGRLVLTVKFIDHHGHIEYFDIIPGKTYMIKARSATKGDCDFIGKIVDFDCIKGVESVLEAPHTVDVGAIIVDTSDDYHSKIVRINMKNIIKILPIDNMNCPMKPPDYDDYFIEDPFSEKKLDDNVKDLEKYIGE